MGSFYDPENDVCGQELYQAFIDVHEARLRVAAVPECKWRTLYRKLSFSVFDAGDNFIYLEEESFENDSVSTNQQHLQVYTKSPMGPEDTEHIYLVDHAWTYTLETAKRTLEENSALVERMTEIMEISADLLDSEKIESILKKMWMFNDCYILKSGNHRSQTTDCWYILDKFGSRICYSEEPSFEMVSFLYSGDNSMYSLLFPKYDVSASEQVTVRYPEYKSSLSDELKQAIAWPWRSCDLSHIDYTLSEPAADYFASGRQEDILPQNEFSRFRIIEKLEGRQLEVYSDYPDIAEFLTHQSFKVVAKKEEAKILWLATRLYNIRELVKICPSFRFISQFPSEQVLINKDLLAAVCRRQSSTSFNSDTLESYPEWLPTTFNLKTELPKFMSYFQNRQKRNLENVWICKPFNLARGLNIHITDNLAQIIRMSHIHPLNWGPMFIQLFVQFSKRVHTCSSSLMVLSEVACKYITDSVLFPVEEKGLVKMDLRYIVLLRSTNPLEVYAYDRFWIRFANKSFSMEDFDDYERHFTVMNYSNFPLQQMYCHDFIRKFEDHYTSYKWCNIQERINKMIKDIFVAATLKEPPAGIAKFSGSRAMYGLDIMLRWDRNHTIPQIQPMILEVNWMPDCQRACQYYPEFYNDVFSVLFLGDTKDKHVVQL